MRKFFKWTAIVLLVLIAALLGWGYAPDIPAKELRAKYANAESEFVDLGDGLTVHLRDEGPKDAPTLILLHGSNASLHTWQQWVDRLGKDYRIIRYDQPGHGLTARIPRMIIPLPALSMWWTGWRRTAASPNSILAATAWAAG